MQTNMAAVFGEYEKAKRQKESLGEKGLYEQTGINARFYSGNQCTARTAETTVRLCAIT